MEARVSVFSRQGCKPSEAPGANQHSISDFRTIQKGYLAFASAAPCLDIAIYPPAGCNFFSSFFRSLHLNVTPALTNLSNIRHALSTTLIRRPPSSESPNMAGGGVESTKGIAGIEGDWLEGNSICFPPETDSVYLSMTSASQVGLPGSAFRDGGVFWDPSLKVCLVVWPWLLLIQLWSSRWELTLFVHGWMNCDRQGRNVANRTNACFKSATLVHNSRLVPYLEKRSL